MFTIEDIRNAFQAGHGRGVFDANNNYFDAPLDEDEYIESLIEKPKLHIKTIHVPYSLIKETVGWSRFCDVTGHNHYSIVDFGEYDLKELFEITLEEYKELWG